MHLRRWNSGSVPAMNNKSAKGYGNATYNTAHGKEPNNNFQCFGKVLDVGPGNAIFIAQVLLDKFEADIEVKDS
jgi:hypothetical protein